MYNGLLFARGGFTPYSIKTRIETITAAEKTAETTLVLPHIPSRQGLKLLVDVFSFHCYFGVLPHIPSRQGLKHLNGNSSLCAKRVLPHIPSRQGLKHEKFEELKTDIAVLPHIPSRQGLKLPARTWVMLSAASGFTPYSIKTRIETNPETTIGKLGEGGFTPYSIKTRIETGMEADNLSVDKKFYPIFHQDKD